MMLTAAPVRVSRALPRLTRCASADPGLFLRALGWRTVLPVLKTLVPVGRLARWMDRRGSPLPASSRHRRVQGVHRLLTEGGRLVISGNCLERSLLLYRFLSEAGADVSMVMGVRRHGTGVAGHAWIEVAGKVLADTTTGDYDPVVRFQGTVRQP